MVILMNIRYTLTSVFLLAVTLALALWAQAFTNDVCDNTQMRITQALVCAKDGDFEESADILASLIRDLDSKKPVFTVVQHHSCGDGIIASLCRAELCARQSELTALELELASAALAVGALVERDMLTLGNIF